MASARAKPCIHLRLFIAGNESNSRRAKENLDRVCETHLQGNFDLKIIDVFKDYQIALKDKIFITPALIVESEQTSTTIFGNLNDTKKLLEALAIEQEAS